MATRRSRQRRTMVAAVAAVAACGLVAASAASLGGITQGDLGADYSVVASCDTDGLVANWDPTYAATIPDYAVGDVDLSGVAAGCTGQNLKVTLTDASDASLAEEVTTVTGASQTVAFAPVVDAELVEGISITIYE